MLYKETSYLHPAVNDDIIKTHKEYLIEFINSLIRCAKKEDTKYSVTRQATPVGEVEPVIHLDRTRQLPFSRIDPSLDIYDHVRFQTGDHSLIPHTMKMLILSIFIFSNKGKKGTSPNRNSTNTKVSNL